MSLRRSGLNPTSYLGVEAPTPPNFQRNKRAPTPKDYSNYRVGDLWLHDKPNTDIEDLFILVSKANLIATWLKIGFGGIRFLTGDTGGLVGIDGNSNINQLGTASHIVTTGTPGNNTITWDIGPTIADTYVCDVGSATPVANILNVLGDGVNISTAGVGNTITITGPATGSSAFSADIIANIANATGAGSAFQVPFDRVYFNIGGDFSRVTGKYTAPGDGLYSFSTTVSVNLVTVAMTDGELEFKITGTGSCVGTWALVDNNAGAVIAVPANQWRFNGSIIVELDQNDTVEVTLTLSNGVGDTATVNIGSGGPPSRTWFSGFRIA